MTYLDISEHQSTIDWDQLAQSQNPPAGVIIRAGYGQNHLDKQFVNNIDNANRLGIPAGAYWFSYAYTEEMARKEAQCLLAAVKPFDIELPLAFDWEYDSYKNAVKHGVTPTPELVQKMTKAFCDTIEEARYYCMLYANPDYIKKFFGELAGGRYDLWLAHWGVSLPSRKCGIWQWGTTTVPGITGGVDTNISYNDYKSLIAKLGLNQPPEEKPWYADAQDWVKENSISDGDRPEDPATRAEVWTMLKRFSSKYNGPRYSGLIDD